MQTVHIRVFLGLVISLQIFVWAMFSFGFLVGFQNKTRVSSPLNKLAKLRLMQHP